VWFNAKLARKPKPIALNAAERTELEQMTQSRTLPAGDFFRARLILLLANGL